TFVFVCIFFFQAEDGIRDATVTGVQTCALPILEVRLTASDRPGSLEAVSRTSQRDSSTTNSIHSRHASVEPRRPSSSRKRATKRSEERRVGKERRARGGRGPHKRKREVGGAQLT